MSDKHPVVDFLHSLKIKLTEEQETAVINGLRIKKKGKSAAFKAKVEAIPAETKMPRQAVICFTALAKQKDPVDLESWGAVAVTEGLQTKQDPARICGYYKQMLLDNGLIEQISNA